MPVPCGANCGRNASLKVIYWSHYGRLSAFYWFCLFKYVQRPKTGDALCKDCFYTAFENEIHCTIQQCNLFKPGDRVAIGASGGKDSTVLAYVMKVLNERYNYGLKLILLSIDEGITGWFIIIINHLTAQHNQYQSTKWLGHFHAGYRDDSLETVKRNRDDYEMELKILSYEELYGWSMDRIVGEIGKTNNCTFCGVFRRQALDRGARLLNVNSIATGHNADDIAETVIMNILRGDTARLSRCTNIKTVGYITFFLFLATICTNCTTITSINLSNAFQFGRVMTTRR